MTCSDLKEEMRHLRREVKALKREFHYLICTSVQEESNPGDSERSFKSLLHPICMSVQEESNPGNSERSFKSLPHPKRQEKRRWIKKANQPKRKKRKKRGQEKEQPKPEDGGHEKDMDPSLCNDLEKDESADSESESVAWTLSWRDATSIRPSIWIRSGTFGRRHGK